MYSSTTIAYAFIKRAIDEGKPINQIKLQRMLYFAHGYHLTTTDKCLLDEQFNVSEYGPIVTSVFDACVLYGSENITDLIYFKYSINKNLNTSIKSLINEIKKSQKFRVFKKQKKFKPGNIDKETMNTIDFTWGILKDIKTSTLTYWSNSDGSVYKDNKDKGIDKMQNEDIRIYFNKFLRDPKIYLSNDKEKSLIGVDPKYIGVPNICFSDIDTGDERESKFRQQRIERGFDDSEMWTLKDTIARFIIPRLERYEEIAKDVLIRDEKLIENINKFIIAMKLTIKNKTRVSLDKDEEKQLLDGLKSFHKMFNSLWI